MIRLAIDAGHGLGNRTPGVVDSGAVAKDGTTEAGIVLAYAKTLKFYALQAGLDVFMVNTGEDSNPVAGRDDQAEAAGCSHFVSLHCNAADAASATGTETLYRDSQDMIFAAKCHRASVQAMKLRDRGLKPENAGHHTRLAVFDFDGAACLIELGFVTNTADLAALLSDENRKTWAKGVIAAVRYS